MKVPFGRRKAEEERPAERPKTAEELAKETEERRKQRIIQLRKERLIDSIIVVGSALMHTDSSGHQEPRGERHSSGTIRQYVQRPYEFKEIIEGKPNRNILTAGTSGEGKSSLVGWLLGQFPERKMIFSFKSDDRYLFMGRDYPVLDISQAVSDPFADVEAFVCAFTVAYPISTVGVIASYVPVLLRELVLRSRSWKELEATLEKDVTETRDSMKRSALGFIREHVKPLVSYNSAGVSLPGKNVVFDFSNLNEDAKTFYAELLLRKIWNGLRGGETNRAVVLVDEAHRLTRARFEKYESILHEMAREIRAKGALGELLQGEPLQLYEVDAPVNTGHRLHGWFGIRVGFQI